MKKLLLAVSVLAMSASAVIAADDPIAVRKALMQAVRAPAGASGALMESGMGHNPRAAQPAGAGLRMWTRPGTRQRKPSYRRR